MKKFDLRIFCLHATLLLGLSACASVNPAGLAKLAAMDPLTADPQQITVAARLPESLRLRTGDLMMLVKTTDTAGPDAINETFHLAVEDANPGDAGLIMPEPGERLQLARIAPGDIVRMRATQAKARALKAAGGTAQNGSMTVSAQGGCKTAELPDGPMKLNIYMQTEADGEWFPVVDALDLRRALGAEMLAKIPDC